MSLRVKLFLGIILFFSLALSFFGYMAYQSAVQSGTAREMALLQDLSLGLSRDLRTDIGATPNDQAITSWLREFNSLHFSIMVSSGDKLWLSDKARSDVARSVRNEILKLDKSGSMTSGDMAFEWDTHPITGTAYTLTVIHRTNLHDATIFFKRLTVPLIIAAFIIIWVAIWTTQYIAALMEKLNAQKDSLHHQAMHDALTNLPNRTLMLDQLQTVMHEVDQQEAEMALLFIDLNRFKDINDTLGHHFGDLLLVEISRRLLGVLRKSDMVARLGGDEFAVILGHINEDVAKSIADKIIDVIAKPIEIKGNNLFVSASIGISRYPAQATDSLGLVQYADVAMYAAKRSGIGVVVYDASMDTHSRDRLNLSNDLRDATERGEMSLCYQAKTDIHTGTVVGAEALLRWQHNGYGVILPEQFIPLAEQTGNIRSLTAFVFKTAMHDLKKILDKGYDMTFSINLSAISLRDLDLPSTMLKAVEKHRIAPSRIVLEITETAVMERTIHTTEVLTELDRMGFRISMDDFGTGHSSLVNLRLLPLQELKIDKSFIINMLKNEDDATIVRTIIELGHSLGKSVVAEGVETKKIMDALARLGCDMAQGYFINHPMPIDAFEAWLEKDRGSPDNIPMWVQ